MGSHISFPSLSELGGIGSGEVDEAAFTRAVSQATHGLSQGDWVYLTAADTYAAAKADAEATAEVVGIVDSSADGNNFVLRMGGVFANASGLTANAPLFLSEATAGATSEAAPTTSGEVVKPVGYAKSATEIEINIMRGSVIA